MCLTRGPGTTPINSSWDNVSMVMGVVEGDVVVVVVLVLVLVVVHVCVVNDLVTRLLFTVVVRCLCSVCLFLLGFFSVAFLVFVLFC